MTKKESEMLTVDQVQAYLNDNYDVEKEQLTTELLVANLKSKMRPKCIVE